MRKYKYFTVIIAFTLFLFFDWLIVNIKLITNLIESGLFTESEIFLNINDMNFEAISRLSFVYIIPFIVILYFFLKNDRIATMVRFKSRTDFVNRKLIDIVIIAIIFAFVHELINIIVNYLNFSSEILRKYNFLIYSIINMLVIALYYVRVGVVFFILKTLYNKSAIIFTILIYATENLVIYQYLLYYSWLPCRDSVVLFNLMTNVYSYMDIILLFVRGLGMNILLIMISYSIFIRKDLFLHEKQ